MGEYAKYNGQEIKIGTCEDMYYLRYDQLHLIDALPGKGSRIAKAEAVRFRFPFPDEDSSAPGARNFEEYDKGYAVDGIETPVDVKHASVYFSSSRPPGLAVYLPCPASFEAKAASYEIEKDHFGRGSVSIRQQRLVKGQLVLVCACAYCGALYRLPSLEDAQPILEFLRLKAQAARKDGEEVSAKYDEEIARRIVNGYLGKLPNGLPCNATKGKQNRHSAHPIESGIDKREK